MTGVQNPIPATPASPIQRRHPLRFVWYLDEHGRFSIDSDEFIAALAVSKAAVTGRSWAEIAAELALDPAGEITRAIATRDTWSGISISWPMDDGSDRIAIELSGLPVFDHERAFVATAALECAATSHDLLVEPPLALKTRVAVSQRLELMWRQALRLPSGRQARMSFHFPRAPLKPQCPPSARVSTWPFANFHASSHKGWLRLGLNTSHATPAARNSKMLQLPCKLSLSGLFPICGPSLIGFQLPS